MGRIIPQGLSWSDPDVEEGFKVSITWLCTAQSSCGVREGLVHLWSSLPVSGLWYLEGNFAFTELKD